MFSRMIDLIRHPSADEMATREMEECRRDLLNAERNRDYYAKMAEFNKVRMTQLAKAIREPEEGRGAT